MAGQAKEGTERTRKTIINLLKQEGPMDAHQLAEQLGVTAMAVRQHLYHMQEKRLVTYTEEARAMGRPAKMWALTPEANRLFPDGYAELTIGLIDSMKEAFGEDGLDKLLDIRNRKLIDAYKSWTPDHLAIKDKLAAFAAARTAEGYMAEIVEQPDGSFSFVEKHCPICDAAQACSKLCKKELEMFQAVLGDHVTVTREEHIVTGANRCVYAIVPNGAIG